MIKSEFFKLKNSTGFYLVNTYTVLELLIIPIYLFFRNDCISTVNLSLIIMLSFPVLASILVSPSNDGFVTFHYRFYGTFFYNKIDSIIPTVVLLNTEIIEPYDTELNCPQKLDFVCLTFGGSI